MSKQPCIVNANSVQPSLSALGEGTLPAGTTADAAVAIVENVLAKKLQGDWPSTYPDYETDQQDQGIMGPWNANVAGAAPQCVVQQLTGDFNAWELPSDDTTINAIATQITQEISSNGGLSGTFYGRTRVGGSETIYWGVAFATGAIQDNPEVLGIIYVFTAQLGVN